MKLMYYEESDKFKELPEEERFLIQAQETAMGTYANILSARLEKEKEKLLSKGITV